MPWRSVLYPRLTEEVASILRAQAHTETLEEIRAYSGCPLELVFDRKRVSTELIMDEARMERLLAALSGYALYRFERELAQGYLPIGGGHRAGVCGRMIMEDGVWRMSGAASLCIRICRCVSGAAAPVYDQLMDESCAVRRVLFLGKPGSGKTTALRDAAIYLAQRAGIHVAAADEREELFAGKPSIPIDVMSGMDKAQAMLLLLRSMAPQAIVTDEIGRMEDAQAIEDIARCGIGLLASAHAGSLSDCLQRPVLRRLMEGRAFDRYVLLKRHRGRTFFRIWDENGQEIGCREERINDQSGCGSDGHDCNQRDGVSDFGRRAAPCALDSGHAPVPSAHERHHPL